MVMTYSAGLRIPRLLDADAREKNAMLRDVLRDPHRGNMNVSLYARGRLMSAQCRRYPSVLTNGINLQTNVGTLNDGSGGIPRAVCRAARQCGPTHRSVGSLSSSTSVVSIAYVGGRTVTKYLTSCFFIRWPPEAGKLAFGLVGRNLLVEPVCVEEPFLCQSGASDAALMSSTMTSSSFQPGPHPGYHDR